MKKITANDIKRKLIRWCIGGYDIVLPGFFYGSNECDVFRINESDFVFEYEIKISRSDFFADFKKEKKHERLRIAADNTPNRFFYVCPENLIKVEEVPVYAGLIYFSDPSFIIMKSAKLIHKNKFTKFRMIARTICFREANLRSELYRAKHGDYKKEIARLEKLIEGMEERNRDLSYRLIIEQGKKKVDASTPAHECDATAAT